MSDPNRDPDTPSPKRKARAGVTVVVILVAMVLAVFVGRNLWHAEQPPDYPAPAQAPAN